MKPHKNAARSKTELLRNSTTRTLAAAQQRLRQASAERADHQTALTLLSIEIPNLENTIRVLSAQLQPAGTALPPDLKTSSFQVVERIVPLSGVIRHEVDDSMGSIPAKDMPTMAPYAEEEVDPLEEATRSLPHDNFI